MVNDRRQRVDRKLDHLLLSIQQVVAVIVKYARGSSSRCQGARIVAIPGLEVVEELRKQHGRGVLLLLLLLLGLFFSVLLFFLLVSVLS